MPAKVILPKFGQTVEVSEITQWTKREGEVVKKGDVLCEISTDKSSLEVESPYDGTLLKIILPVQRSAPVGCVIAILGTPGEVLAASLVAECEATLTATPTLQPAAAPIAAAAASAPAPARPALPPSAATATSASRAPVSPSKTVAGPHLVSDPALPERLFVSPRARKLAFEREVPLAVLQGSGEHGRIVEADVEAYLSAVGPVSPTARKQALERGVDLRVVRQEGTAGRIMIDDLKRAHSQDDDAADAAEVLPPLQSRLETCTPMRRAIAAAMLASARDIPAFALETTIDASPMIELRAVHKRAGSNAGYGDFIARAVSMAIHRHPMFAAQWKDGSIQWFDRVDLAFAVAIPGGLVTPVVRDCSSLSVQQISEASLALVEKARAGKLKMEDYSNAVFTLSNLGGFPIDRFTAIVPPGQSGILAIGRIRDEVVVQQGGIFMAKRLSLTLSADHRYIDGADGARFLATVKELLEAPSRL